MKTTVDRRDEIVRLLNKNGKVKVEELSKQFDVSSVTIRNDLDYLEKKGIVHRTYGGALIRDIVAYDSSLTEKQKLHAEEKRKIGIKAAELIHDGESIILDSGTTTRQIAVNIKEKQGLTVLTNAINIAVELAGLENITVMLTGGTLRKKSYSLVGPEAEHALTNYFFDKLFLGVDGFGLDSGLTTPNPLEAQLNRLMVQMANEVIAVTDSSKFGRRSFSFICELDGIDQIITDKNIPNKYTEDLKKRNISIITI
ncbi:MAG: DeoR/GlpR family DNA-binding transcription regulator [Candidatus Marinimicrobia bacterium]|nr:DeoR/GlpR family DNA-binding transcription regulator [Candidatus Neomarinimicrobiota bacterium]MCF7829362.1 DeoR/GlpR family DNA-binding transcription regulator [Candidatus Neomarinimicrobiota bacterium]MCF7880848.1 DeoR/GlpR family DNA-binding transcription regulator [Candidatus Neomarinimicrobiota bacterium]